MTRPPKQRAWTKRDQKEWLAQMPVVLSEPIRHPNGDQWLWRHWCPFCKQYHHHSPKPGHRSEHCTNPDSPFKRTGYILKLDPKFRDRDALAQFQKRETAAHMQRIAGGRP